MLQVRRSTRRCGGGEVIEYIGYRFAEWAITVGLMLAVLLVYVLVVLLRRGR